ncbi:MAG: toxin-antitoxin system YwqK family antitoxin [Bacteroidota bacterium]
MKATHLKLAVICFVMAVFPLLLMAQPVGKTNVTDSLGRKQGYWKKYSKDTLKYEGQFKDDIPVGEFKYYFFNGKVKAQTTYSDNGKVAKTIMYHPGGAKNGEGTYVDKKKDGTWVYYGINGMKISEENYVKGVKTGVWKYYYEDGRINRIENYKNDHKNGEWMEFYQDSVLKTKGTYVNDKLNGVVQCYGLTGKVFLTGKYVDDLKQGEWMFFNDLGAGERKLTYKDSYLMKEEVIVPTKGGNKYINAKSIAWCEAIGKETHIKLITGEDITATVAIDTVDRLLGQINYFRVNSTFEVAIWAIKNRKTFNKDNPVLTLNPDPGKLVSVDASVMEGFMSWADLIKYDK